MIAQNVIGTYLQPGRGWHTRNLSSIKVITIHHDAYPHDNRQDKTLLQSIMNVHAGKGWPGMSYHYWIGRTGNTYQVNQLDWITWHDSVNSDSIGICLTGYFHSPHNNSPDKRQIESLKTLLRDLKIKFPNAKIVGHRDRSATACPGDVLYPQLKTIIEDSMSSSDDTIAIPKRTFEELVRKSSIADSFIEKGWDNPGLIEKIIQDLKEDLERERNTNKQTAEEFKRSYKDLVRRLAEDLNTVQQEPEIFSEIRKALEAEEELRKKDPQWDKDRKAWLQSEMELKQEIARLNMLLQQESVLANSSTSELIQELIRRLQNIVRRVQ